MSNADFIQGEDFQKTIRGIHPDTFKFWKYKVKPDGDKTVHIANHFKDGQLIGQKIRGKNKSFHVIGETDSLYGKWLWGAGKRLVICEGELDALSVSQIQGNKWQTVSVPLGANGAARAIRNSIDWVSQFDEVVFMFDMDEPGQEAAIKCAQLLKPGTAKIAKLSMKDANEMLVAGEGKALMAAIWNAEVFRPDGIVSMGQLRDKVMKPVEWGRPWCWDELTKATYGRRDGDVITIGAGSGIGKTDVITEQILFDLHTLKLNVGAIMLEQDPTETVRRVTGKHAGFRFHVPDAGWTSDDQGSAFDDVNGADVDDHFFLYDSFGSTDWETIQQRIRYMAISLECKHIYLDHLTALAAHADDERREIEMIMADLASLAKELQITLHVISHLSTPEGKSHEEGGRVSAKHFKGSRSIAFWSYFMIGLERNGQAEDLDERNTTTVRIIKDRYTGQSTGFTFQLRYNHETGRLKSHQGDPFGTEDEDIF